MAHSKNWICKQISHFNNNIENVPVINHWNENLYSFLPGGVPKWYICISFGFFLHLYLMPKVSTEVGVLFSLISCQRKSIPQNIPSIYNTGSSNRTKNKLCIDYSAIWYPLAVTPISLLKVLIQITNTILRWLKLVSKNFPDKVGSSHTVALLFHWAIWGHSESKRVILGSGLGPLLILISEGTGSPSDFSLGHRVAVLLVNLFFFLLRKVIAKMFMEFSEHQGQYPGKN